MQGVYIMTEKIKYINDDKQYGIVYDWHLIFKAYRALKCPKDVYNPTTAPISKAKIFVELSERNVGKTTNWLLIGMIMNIMYGTIIQYVRQREEMIMPKSMSDLFDTILKFDYVSKVTGGEYDSVFYKSRRYYYAKTDESGKVIDISPEPFMFCCCVEKADMLKSSHNAPTGDLIIYDEFIGKYYYQNEFVHFCDLVKTIIRGRRSPIVVMLANTINPNSTYFNELEIFDRLQRMKTGENDIVTTAKGTNIYIEIIGTTTEKKRKNNIINQLFFGFKNPLLASITGEDSWAIDNYQHIPEVIEGEEEPEVITHSLYILHSNKLVRLDVVKHDSLGICIYTHWATRTYEDSYIMTVEFRFDKRYHNRLGNRKIESFLMKCFSENRFYYASNDIGAFVENYVQNVCKTY